MSGNSRDPSTKAHRSRPRHTAPSTPAETAHTRHVFHDFFRSRLDQELRDRWRDAAHALFNDASCDSLRHTWRLADLIRETEIATTAAPTRVEFRDTLDRIAALAEELARLLSSYSVHTFAREVADALAENGRDSAHVLAGVARLARRRRDIVSTGPGRGSAAAPLGYGNSHIQCAAAVAEVWRWRHGRDPSNGDTKARAACAALWRLAGGTVTANVEAGGTEDAAMWDRHLRTVAPRSAGEPMRHSRGEQARFGGDSSRAVAVQTARDSVSRVLAGY